MFEPFSRIRKMRWRSRSIRCFRIKSKGNWSTGGRTMFEPFAKIREKNKRFQPMVLPYHTHNLAQISAFVNLGFGGCRAGFIRSNFTSP